MYVSVRKKFSVESFSLICPFFILITNFQSMLIFTYKTMTIMSTMENKKTVRIINVWDLCRFKGTVS